MAEREQVRPLAPAAVRPVSDGATAGDSEEEKTRRRRNHIRCLGCVAATVLLHSVIILILALTVFRVKGPKIEMRGVRLTRLDVSLGSTRPQMRIPRPMINMSMVADVSVKNPNAASFKFGNTTTEVYYRGKEVGEAYGPPGKAKARRTVRMSLSVDIMADRFLSSGLDLVRDVRSGMLNVTTYTRLRGRVTILGFVKKHPTVKMNCTVTLNFTSRDVQGFKCNSKVHI